MQKLKVTILGLTQLDAVRGARPPKFFKEKLGRASEACDQAVWGIILRGSKRAKQQRNAPTA